MSELIVVPMLRLVVLLNQHGLMSLALHRVDV